MCILDAPSALDVVSLNLGSSKQDSSGAKFVLHTYVHICVHMHLILCMHLHVKKKVYVTLDKNNYLYIHIVYLMILENICVLDNFHNFNALMSIEFLSFTARIIVVKYK